MGQLNILGAQRVKALTDVLNKQMEAEIAQAKVGQPTDSDIEASAKAEFGVDKLKCDLDSAIEYAESIARQLSSITGTKFTINLGEDRYRPKDTEYQQTIKNAIASRDAVYEAIEAKYKEKESQLWLCETLEAAKEIVGIK